MEHNVLFICSANKQRSKTAEDYFSALYPEINFRSAGTNIRLCEKEGTTPVTKELLEWAATIFVMEHSHAKAVKQLAPGGSHNKIVALNIADRYKYY